MKAVNDFRIKVSDVPFYETGIDINRYDVFYYTGINPGTESYGSITQVINKPFKTGYYYALYDIPSGKNRFYARPGYSDPNITSQWTQNWSYTPSYGSSISFRANLNNIKLGEGYEYVSATNENTLHIEASLRFDGISDLESKSISHFYQNNSISTGYINSQEGITKINLKLFHPHDRIIPGYIKDISYNYKYANVNDLLVNVESPFLSSADWKESTIPFSTAQIYKKDEQYIRDDYVFIEADASFATRGFWYCTANHPVSSFPPDSVTGEWTQKFYFQPDGTTSINLKSDNYKNQKDNFYFYQKQSDQDNLLSLKLSFNNRDDKQAKAILHFLNEKKGIDIFEFDGVPNFTGTKNFYCPEWNHTINYKDNNSIEAIFYETLNGAPEPTVYNTLIFNSGTDFGFVPSGFAVTKEVVVFNSGKGDISYEVQPIIKGDGRFINPIYLDTTTINAEKFNQLTVGTYSSGIIQQSFYMTDREVLSPNVTGPTRWNSRQEITQEGFFDGSTGPVLEIRLTGRSDKYDGTNFPTGPGAPWLGYNGYCIAWPEWDEENKYVNLKTRWKPPKTGYFFERFEVDISTDSSFSSILQTKQVEVERLNENDDTFKYIYGSSLSGLAETYETALENIDFDQDYYVRVAGCNDRYSVTGRYVYASGVNDPDMNISNKTLNSGIVQSPVRINFPKVFGTVNLSEGEYFNYNLYPNIKNEAIYSDAFRYYSGIIVNIGPNTSVGAANVDFVYTKEEYNPESTYFLQNTGAFIITGDYSSLPYGVEINLRRNSKIVGHGGIYIDPKDEISPFIRSINASSYGNTALYLFASGDFNVNVFGNSYIAAGGGAGLGWARKKLNFFLNQMFIPNSIISEYPYVGMSPNRFFAPYHKWSKRVPTAEIPAPGQERRDFSVDLDDYYRIYGGIHGASAAGIRNVPGKRLQYTNEILTTNPTETDGGEAAILILAPTYEDDVFIAGDPD